MYNDLQPAQDRRLGADDRRMRDRTPSSDRRIESSLDQRPASSAGRAEDAPSAQADPQMLFERS